MVRVECPIVNTVNLAEVFTLATRDAAESSLAEAARLLTSVNDFVFVPRLTVSSARARYLTQFARPPKINRLESAGVAHW